MTRRILSCTLIALLAATGLCTGCSSKYGVQTTDVSHYPQCYRPVAQLRSEESSTTKSTVAGAAGGALLGAIIGGLATGKVSGAVAGAAAGGVTGAVGGNIYGKAQQRSRDEAYLRKYSAQLGSEAAGMDRASAAAKVAMQCYDRQFDVAVRQYREGRISRDSFEDRYDEIRSGLVETSAILKTTSAAMADKEREYRQVLAEDFEYEDDSYDEPAPAQKARTTAQQAPARRQQASSSQEREPVVRESSTWKSSKRELDATEAEANAQLDRYARTVDALEG
jgi:outer membrane lipoprotein SlyB